MAARVGAIILVIAALGSGGCIVIPIPRNAAPVPESRRPLEQRAASAIRAGESTRQEVLLQLGEPDVVCRDERLLIYGWTTTSLTLLWAAGGGYSGAAGATDVPTNSFLLVEFDEFGVVRRFETRKAPLGTSGGTFLADLRTAW